MLLVLILVRLHSVKETSWHAMSDQSVISIFMQGDDPRFDRNMDYHKRFTREWDEPEIDENLDCTKPCNHSKA